MKRAEVFFSYHNEDADYTRALVRELRQIGVNGFLDQSDLSAGAGLTEPLRQAIEDAVTMVVILSPAASRSNWVGFEVGVAQSLGKRIISVVAPGETPESDEFPDIGQALLLVADDHTVEEVATAIVAATRNVTSDEALLLVSSPRSRKRQRSMAVLGLAVALVLIAILLLL